MKIEDYKLGQKVSLYGVIEEINIEDIHDKENTTTLKINTLARTISVNPKWEEVTIDLDQPKPVIPKFVAEWLEKSDWRKDTLGRQTIFDVFDNLTLDASNGFYVDVKKWVEKNGNIFAKAWVFGYEIEQEKLYTVEIPNPNEGQLSFVLMRQSDGNVRIKIVLSSNLKLLETDSDFQLTEAEIKQDFEWAWQWAKEVTE